MDVNTDVDGAGISEDGELPLCPSDGLLGLLTTLIGERSGELDEVVLVLMVPATGVISAAGLVVAAPDDCTGDDSVCRSSIISIRIFSNSLSCCCGCTFLFAWKPSGDNFSGEGK